MRVALAHLLGGGILLQDVAIGLNVGIDVMHHFPLLPQIALHHCIDVVIPGATANKHEPLPEGLD